MRYKIFPAGSAINCCLVNTAVGNGFIRSGDFALQNHIAAGDYRLFSFGKSENVNIFGGTDKSVPYDDNAVRISICRGVIRGAEIFVHEEKTVFAKMLDMK